MECINGLDYIATENIDVFMNAIEKNKKLFLSKRRVSDIIRQCAHVTIYIGDHDWMRIETKDSKLLCDLLDIIRKFS